MSMQLYCAGKRAGEGARLVLPPGGCGAKLCCEAPDHGEGEGQYIMCLSMSGLPRVTTSQELHNARRECNAEGHMKVAVMLRENCIV